MKRFGKSIRTGVCALASLSAIPAAASGLYCANVEIPLEMGATLRVECEGTLYLDRLSILRADELIELRSSGDMILWGTLVAPAIVLVSNTNISLGGGLFSGSPEAFPEVVAASWTNTVWERVRDFSDLVPRPYVDPVFGASTITQVVSPPQIEIPPVTNIVFVLIPDDTLISPIPEPAPLALFAAALGLLAWKRSRAERMSHSAQANCNLNAKLEN